MAILKLTSSAARILSPRAIVRNNGARRRNKQQKVPTRRPLARFARYDKVVPVAVLVLSSESLSCSRSASHSTCSASYINTSSTLLRRARHEPWYQASLLNVLGPAQAQATIDPAVAQLELLPHGDRDEGHRLDDDLAHEKRRALLVEGRGHLARVCEGKGSGLGLRLGSGMPLGLGLGVSAR